MYVIVLQFY